MKKSVKFWIQFSVVIIIILFCLSVFETYVSLLILTILLIFIYFKYPSSKSPILIIITQILIIFAQPSSILNLKEALLQPQEINIYVSNIRTINRSNYDFALLNTGLNLYVNNFDDFSELFTFYSQEQYPKGYYTISLLSPYLGGCLNCTYFYVTVENNGEKQLDNIKIEVKTPNNIFNYSYVEEGIFIEKNKGLFFDGSSNVIIQSLKPNSTRNFVISTPNFESISVLCDIKSKVNCSYFYFKILHERIKPIPQTFTMNPGMDTEKVWDYPSEKGFYLLNTSTGFSKINNLELSCVMPGQCGK